MTSTAQPLAVANDWRSLRPPPIGSWEPRLTVSVVVPAHDPVHLAAVLASLTAQSYPGHLVEAVVVDDGSQPPVSLPERRPARTLLVRTGEGWGRAAACQTGAEAATGQVLHWLDADMVLHREHLEAQLRWHHLIDYAVVLGHKLLGRADALDHLTPDDLAAALRAGTCPTTLARGTLRPHEWVEDFWRRTDDLAAAGPRAMRVHVGATASVGRALFDAAGGFPTDLLLGEDIALGYRLREAGALFVGEREARALHLGDTTVTGRSREVNRYNRPFLADKVPEFRRFRDGPPRPWTVPYVEVVLPAEGQSAEEVSATVERLLAGPLPDVVVTLLGDWSGLSDKRRHVLDDPDLDLRLARARFASDPRVRTRDTATPVSDATFRLWLPGPCPSLDGRAVRALVRRVEATGADVVVDEALRGSTLRLERSSSVARARRCIP